MDAKMKNALLSALAMYGMYRLGKGTGYVQCMNDVVDQHSEDLPDGKLTLSGGKKKRKYSISVSKPKKTEES